MSNYKKALNALAYDASADGVAMTHALLAVADAITAHNRPTPTVESPATGVPDTPPAPVGVGTGSEVLAVLAAAGLLAGGGWLAVRGWRR